MPAPASRAASSEFAPSAGGSSVFNAGTISGGTAAIQFGGIGNTLTLAQGSVISGNVLGTGSDTFQLGGTGAATFDVVAARPRRAVSGFWHLQQDRQFGLDADRHQHLCRPVNVNAGTLVVNGDITSVEQHHGQCRRHARRQRHRRQHHNQCRRHAGAGQFDRAARPCRATSCSLRRRAIWSRSRPPMPTAPM